MVRTSQPHYSAFYAFQFVLLGVQLPFYSGWLALNGFAAGEIGLITGIALALRLGLGPFAALWADGHSDDRTALRIVSFFFAAGAVALSLTPGSPVIVAATVVVFFTFGLLVPLSDAAVLREDRNGALNYGQTRASGSIAFLITNIAAGFVLAEYGIAATVLIMAGAGVATFAAAMALPGNGDRSNAAGNPDEERISWRHAPKLLASRPFLLMILSAGFIQGSHATYYAFSILHWSALGFSPRTIGALWAIGVAAEIVLLMRARLVSRIGPAALIMIGGGAACLRWLVIASEPPLALLFVAQLLHAATFAATYLGALAFIDQAAPHKLTKTAMTLNSTTGVGAITGIATIAAGYVYSAMGAEAAYIIMAGMGALGAAGAAVLSKHWRGERLAIL